jgi:hypothetical protein
MRKQLFPVGLENAPGLRSRLEARDRDSTALARVLVVEESVRDLLPEGLEIGHQPASPFLEDAEELVRGEVKFPAARVVFIVIHELVEFLQVDKIGDLGKWRGSAPSLAHGYVISPAAFPHSAKPAAFSKQRDSGNHLQATLLVDGVYGAAPIPSPVVNFRPHHSLEDRDTSGRLAQLDVFIFSAHPADFEMSFLGGFE